jgi:predicted PurR-regulated permease PerM
MDPAGTRRVELLLPMRTIILVAATLGVLVAFKAIGDTFLIVFVGIFLALVFEYPVRFVMRRTHMSRGLAATVTVLGTAVAVTILFLLLLVPLVGSVRDYLQDLPQTAARPGTSSRAPSRSPSPFPTLSRRCSGSREASSASSSPPSRSSSSASSS